MVTSSGLRNRICGCLLRRFNDLEGKYGRHEETRTPDLYRVNLGLTCIYNNLHDSGRKTKSLKRQLDRNKTFLIVHELCMEVCPRTSNVCSTLGYLRSP